MQVRSVFINELKNLRNEIQAMAKQVEEDLDMAVKALRNNDAKLAEKVISNDEIINAMQIKIDDETAILLATQQPVARDLRELITILRLTSSLERIGDHTVHLAKTVIKLSDKPPISSTVRMESMAETGREMIRDAICAYLNHDAAAARSAALQDDKIDKEHKALTKEVLTVMKENPKFIKQAVKILHTSGQLERLGDHITNICESIIYMVEGARVELN